MDVGSSPEKRKGGRPKLGARKRSQNVRVYLTEAEAAWLSDRAYRSGHSVSYFCRTRLLALSTRSA